MNAPTGKPFPVKQKRVSDLGSHVARQKRKIESLEAEVVEIGKTLKGKNEELSAVDKSIEELRSAIASNKNLLKQMWETSRVNNTTIMELQSRIDSAKKDSNDAL